MTHPIVQPPRIQGFAHCVFVLFLALGSAAVATAANATQAGRDPVAHSALERARSWAVERSERIPSGVLYDLVLPVSGLPRFDGRLSAPSAGAPTWYQAHLELRSASLMPVAGFETARLRERAKAMRDRGLVALAFLHAAYDRLSPPVILEEPLRTTRHRSTVASCLVDRVAVDREIAFQLDPEFLVEFGDDRIEKLAVDLDDGRGIRPLTLGLPLTARYPTAGPRTIRFQATTRSGEVRYAATELAVEAAIAPPPDDTLEVTASVPYLGASGSGRAYVALAPGHAAITNPILVVEGFDLSNDMDWDVLHGLLNQAGLLDTLQARGYDAVVLDFTDATDYIQRNSFVVAELIQQIEAAIEPWQTIAVVGASMGALCSRYALAYLEDQGGGHRARIWLSFDGPHGGANVPLGLQYWTDFFAGQSASAEEFGDLLNRPAARQMLAYHFTDPPSSTPGHDAARDSLLADFAALGEYPTGLRRVAVANGSGTGATQGFLAGAQIVDYDFSDALVGIRGDIWALPDQVGGTIFDGLIRILIFPQTQVVSVSGVWPLDGAPGGWRGSMAQLDTTAAPYGDIVALHDNHAFVPTVSALALDTEDPLYDVAGDLDLLSHTPFEAVLYPAENEEHIEISEATAAWIVGELDAGVVDVPAPGVPRAALALGPVVPNPAAGEVRIRFTLPEAGPAALRLYDVSGRLVRELWSGHLPAGAHAAAWRGLHADGRVAPAGVYFVELESGGETRRARLVRIR